MIPNGEVLDDLGMSLRRKISVIVLPRGGSSQVTPRRIWRCSRELLRRAGSKRFSMQGGAYTAFFTRGSAYSVAPGDGTSNQESSWEIGTDVGGPAISVAKDIAFVLLGLAEEAKVWTQGRTRRRGGSSPAWAEPRRAQHGVGAA